MDNGFLLDGAVLPLLHCIICSAKRYNMPIVLLVDPWCNSGYVSNDSTWDMLRVNHRPCTQFDTFNSYYCIIRKYEI